MTMKKATKFDFAAALKKLESIVDIMERGGAELGLEESLKLFAEGVALTKQCQAAIKSAEQQVQILTGDNLSDFTPAKEPNPGEEKNNQLDQD